MARHTIQLTKRLHGIIVGNNQLQVVTEQSVGGGGSRNVVTWALLASKKGFNRLELVQKYPNEEVEKDLRKAVDNANELVGHLGLVVNLI